MKYKKNVKENVWQSNTVKKLFSLTKTFFWYFFSFLDKESVKKRLNSVVVGFFYDNFCLGKQTFTAFFLKMNVFKNAKFNLNGKNLQLCILARLFNFLELQLD